MAKAKTTNYTPEMIDALKAGYTGSDNASEIAALATATGKTPASVRAKLASFTRPPSVPAPMTPSASPSR
jgi:predicted pyridoxine 5'-phosphate oxidase superfamily flavin-nucleotide-binding protein